MSSQKKILKGIMHLGGITLMSRFFGLIRDLLLAHYLGVSGLSDAFLTAYKIPNSLRKIFAEGALSAAFVPRVVPLIKKEGVRAVTGLMALSFLIFEGSVLALCALVMWRTDIVLRFIAPGFSQEQLSVTISILRIVMPYIFFVSSSALLAGPLQAVGHFFVPIFSQVVSNIIVIGGLLLGCFFHFPVTIFCWFILASGCVQLILHCIVYFSYHFSFSWPSLADYKKCKSILWAFLLCLPSVSMMEIALFIDTSFASYLKPGSLSLLYYANRFVGIPLGVFAVAFSTIVLPHFSHIHTYSPRRLHFYLFESAKFIFWVTFPVTLVMIFFAHDIFLTLFASKFTVAQIIEAASILRFFTVGLFFFSLNKILFNIFYAMHNTWIPAVVSLCTVLLNIVLNQFLIMPFQSIGLVMATVIAAAAQSFVLLFILHVHNGFRLYVASFSTFVMRYCVHIACVSIPLLSLYYGIKTIIVLYVPYFVAHIVLETIGVWLWVGPLVLLFMFPLFYYRLVFKIHLHFLQ